jgi:hypothetical protein
MQTPKKRRASARYDTDAANREEHLTRRFADTARDPGDAIRQIERAFDTDIDFTPPEQRVHPWQLVVRSKRADIAIRMTISQARSPGVVHVDASLSSTDLGKHGDFLDVFDCAAVRFDVVEEFTAALVLAVKTAREDHPELVTQAFLLAQGADVRDIVAATRTDGAR